MNHFEEGNLAYMVVKIAKQDENGRTGFVMPNGITYWVDANDAKALHPVGDKVEDEVESSNEISEAYSKGLNDVWEMTRKILFGEADGGIPIHDLSNIFGVDETYHGYTDIFKNNTATEAIEKIKAWEESKEVHVGDIIMLTVDDKYGENQRGPHIVMWVEHLGDGMVSIDTVAPCGATYAWSLKENTIIKTGRTVDVNSFLKQIGGGQE